MPNKILLVEDEALIAMSEAKMLEKHGYEVVSVYNGEKAIEAIAADPAISLILMDIDLGKGMDGTEAAEEILKKKDIPVVFLSSHTEPEIVEKTEKITSYGYVVKNSGATVLGASIKMAFKLFHAKNEAKKHEEGLRESEASIRKKLKAITEPDGDIDTLNLADIIDYEELQTMMEDFYNLSGIGGAILDISGKILVGVAWQEICSKFHRVHPDTLKNCLESDLNLTEGVPEGTCKAYRCKNNMWDIVTPIMVDEKHLGNIYIGQFFFEDEVIDYELFRNQARQYGFDETEYLAALDRVPRFSRESVDRAMDFYSKLAKMISSLSYTTLKLSKNIVKHKQAEERLKKSEEKFRTFVENANDIIYQLTPEGVFTYVSPNWTEVLGYQQEEVIGERVEVFVHPDDLHLCIDFLNKVLTTGEKQSGVEYRVKHKNGAWQWHNSNGAPLKDENGKIISYIGIGREITERKQVEKAQLKANLRLITVIDSMDAIVYITDMETYETIFINECGRKIFGYIAGQVCWKAIQGQDEPCAFCTNDKLLDKDGKPTGIFAWEHQNTLNGRWYDCRDSAVQWHDGRMVRIEVATDITERKQAEELLKKRNATLHKINQYSIELSFLRYDDLYPYIVKKLKDIFKISTAWVSEYDEKTSQLVVKSTSLSDENSSWTMKKLGKKIIGYSVNLDEEHYKMMRNVQVGNLQTLHEVSFGTIPENIAISIEKGLNLDWFMPVVFINNAKITGAAVIAGMPGKETPDREEILAFAGITGEVIKRKRTEEELKTKKDLLQNITDNMFDSVALTDKNGTFRFVNNAYKKLGYDINNLLGKNALDFVHPEDINRIVASFKEIIQSDEPQRKEEFRYRCADGGYIWVESVGKKLHGEEGEIKELIFSARDITERKNIELLNKERKQYVEAILNTTPGAIVTLDRDNRINEWNKGAKDLFGYTKEEVVGKRLDDLIAHIDDQIYKDATRLTNKTQTGETISPTEGIRYTKEGTPKDVIIAGSPILVNNTFQGSLGTYTDISLLKQKEKKVQQLLKEKEQLLQEVHHRIKNHMSTIAAIISLRKSHISDSHINVVLDELHNKIRLMQNIYQTLYTGNEVGTIHINSFLGQLLYDIQSTYIKEPSIQIKTDIADIEISSKQSLPIGIIVTELITNAIKYAFEGREEGTISISINKTDENQLKIQVADNGTGLSDMIIENKSYGFGLTLVDGYVKQFDGQMSIDNSHGTNIAVTMKLEE